MKKKSKKKSQASVNAAVPKLAYSMSETCQALGMSYVSIWRLIKRGKLRALGGYGRKIIPVVEIERFLREGITL